MTALSNEFNALYDIVRQGYVEDRMQYSTDDFLAMYRDCNPQVMQKSIHIIAKHPDANVLRVLRVLRAWNLADLKFLIDFLE